MYQKISDLIKNLPKPDKDLLDSLIHVKQFAKSTLVFSEDTLDNSTYYVENGLLRKYVIKDGNEKTIDFFFTDELYFPPILEPNRRTNCFLQAIDQSTVFKLNNFEFDKIKTESRFLLSLENFILDKAHAQAAERLQNFQTMNATERYLNLLERNPRIVQSIALTYVASYLGINKASLSKIRSALK